MKSKGRLRFTDLRRGGLMQELLLKTVVDSLTALKKLV